VGAQIGRTLEAHLARNLASMVDHTGRARQDNMYHMVRLAGEAGHGVDVCQADLRALACRACR
jgi:hypothetical protein